jgi:hypothetical protein
VKALIVVLLSTASPARARLCPDLVLAVARAAHRGGEALQCGSRSLKSGSPIRRWVDDPKPMLAEESQQTLDGRHPTRSIRSKR